MTYADERVELVRRIQQAAPGRALADVLRLDGSALRFHLGTSLADLRVPVSIAPSLADAFARAVRDLFFLLCMRHRPLLKEDEYDHLLLQDDFDSKASRPFSLLPPSQVARDGVRRAFVEAPELHPALDGGILASWIGTGRPGRVLVGALNAVLRRAIAEGQSEPTPYLALLALRNLADSVPGLLRKLPVNPTAVRPLHGALAAGLLVAARLAAREAGASGAPSSALAEAATQALAWSGGLQKLAGSGSHAYGLAFTEMPSRLDGYVHKLGQGIAVAQLAHDVQLEVAESKDEFRRAERAYALAALRADLLSLLRLVEQGKLPAFGLDVQLHGAPGALERTLSSPEKRKELQARVKAAAKACKNEGARPSLESLARVCKDWREDGSGLWPAAVVQKAYSSSIVALACDATLEKLVGEAASPLAHRSGGESEDGIGAEYESGRLYLLGVEERPLLRGRAKAPEMGHLFCDVKDFTRRTAFLKEAVVADFLSREFYTPILTAAARHHHGADHLGDKGGIYLNNLLGDAVSFSGNVASLVALAEDIRRALQNYARRLESEANRDAVARHIAAIEQRHAARQAQLEQQVARTREAQRSGVTEAGGEHLEARIARLSSELAVAADQREAELALARGEKLEAGIFISYGAAPEVATFEDHVFGAIKVAIAEKINESARGTARNGGVRARVDALLHKARSSGGAKAVSCPFSVFVSQPLTIPIPSDAEAAMRIRLDAGDVPGAQRALEESTRQFLSRMVQDRDAPQGGDIYNGGAALSDEALRAYVAARARKLSFLRREIPVKDLHAAIQERFLFPMQTLSLMAGVATGTLSMEELYVYAGRALFKGLEKTGGLGVYEIVPPSSQLFSLLAQHHLAAWLAQPEATVREARTG